MWCSIVEIRWSQDCFISAVGIAILAIQHLHIGKPQGVSFTTKILYLQYRDSHYEGNDNCLIFVIGIPVPGKMVLFWNGVQGPDSIKRYHLTSIGNPTVEIRWSYDRLISTVGFPILVRWHLYIESGENGFHKLGFDDQVSCYDLMILMIGYQRFKFINGHQDNTPSIKVSTMRDKHNILYHTSYWFLHQIWLTLWGGGWTFNI